jgi:hypothetical protein
MVPLSPTHFRSKLKLPPNAEKAHPRCHDLKDPKPLALSTACQESRDVYLKTFNQCIPIGVNGATIRFSPSNTIIFFYQTPVILYLFTLAKEVRPLSAWVHSIEYLAVTDSDFTHLMADGSGIDGDWLTATEYCPKDIDTALKTFGNLKMLTMAKTDSYGPHPEKSSEAFERCCQRLQQEKDRLRVFHTKLAPTIRKFFNDYWHNEYF